MSVLKTGKGLVICFLTAFLGDTRLFFLGVVGRVDVVVSEI